MARRTSSAPNLEASQQAHIEELVSRNRGLEGIINRGKEEASQEKTRTNKIIADIQNKWSAESQEWRDGFDAIQTCHRIAQLRLAEQLELERQNVLTELNATRREKLARIQRDFKLFLFKSKEGELDTRLNELEDENYALQESHAEFLSLLKPKLTTLVKRIDDLEDQLTLVQVRLLRFSLVFVAYT